MSSQTQSDFILNTIATIAGQIQQLTNVYVVKFVNTGDRVIDGSMSIMINTFLVLLGTILYKKIMIVWEYYKIRGSSEYIETDAPTDINHELFDYSLYKIEDIMKYEYLVDTNTYAVTSNNSTSSTSTYSYILNWIKITYKSIKSSKQIVLNCSLNREDLINTHLNEINPTIVMFMPIWKYKNTKTKQYDYIWIIEKKIYAKDFNEFNKLIKMLYDYKIQYNITNDANKQLVEKIPIILKFVMNQNPSFIGFVKETRVFNNIYFDEKPHLLSMLEKFKTETMYPPRLCIDNKIGILLYGPPGTGKTGCISAIANYLKKDVLMINKLTECNLEEQLNAIQRNRNSHILVFDEIDYLLCNKNNGANSNIEEMKEMLLLTQEKEERIKILENINKTNSDDTTRTILQFLDGISDMSGRVIIATTNYPDKINPLFLRPGRFDLKLKLGYCSEPMFQDIVRTVYPDYTIQQEIESNSNTLNTKENNNNNTLREKEETDSECDSLASLSSSSSTNTKTYIQSLLEKKITPLNLINALLQTHSLSELFVYLEQMPVFDEHNQYK